MAAFSVAVQQSVAIENDRHAMVSLLLVCLFYGLAIPNFIEYLFVSLILPYIQPIRLFFSGHNVHAQEILVQHMLILALSLNFNWTLHTNCRREWLRFPVAATTKSTPDCNDFAPSSPRKDRDESGLDVAPVQNLSWDQIDDGYFADEDRDEICDVAMRVRPAPAPMRIRARACQCGAARAAQFSSSGPPAGAGGGGRTAGGAAGRGSAVAPLQHRRRCRPVGLRLPGPPCTRLRLTPTASPPPLLRVSCAAPPSPSKRTFALPTWAPHPPPSRERPRAAGGPGPDQYLTSI